MGYFGHMTDKEYGSRRIGNEKAKQFRTIEKRRINTSSHGATRQRRITDIVVGNVAGGHAGIVEFRFEERLVLVVETEVTLSGVGVVVTAMQLAVDVPDISCLLSRNVLFRHAVAKIATANVR